MQFRTIGLASRPLRLGRCYALGLVVLAAALVTPVGASASVARVDGIDLEFVAAAGEANVVTVSLSGGVYSITDSVAITAGAGCTQAGPNQVNCPSTGVRRVTATADDLNDRVTVTAASPSGSFIHGGPGADQLRGGPKSDHIHGGGDNDRLFGEGGSDELDGGLGNDTLDGGTGSDTVTYESRTAPVRIDLSFKIGGLTGGEIAANERDGILANVENAIGGEGNDEVIGGEAYNTLSGGPGGADIICGGLGVDTVDYSDRAAAVRVSLDGSLETDPNIGGATPSREDCREITNTPTPGVPTAPGQGARDCVPNDGADANGDGVAEEQDCVGEDVENVLGGAGDDILVGNDPDARIAESPRVEPRGFNRLTGGPGNDLLDGRFAPDVFEGGDGIDTVTYASRVVAVNATIDGVADDGDAVGPIGGDLEPTDRRRDNIETDVENVQGGAGNDVLRGGGQANRLGGGPGDDTIFGGDGAGPDDALSGDAGNDRVHGGDGGDLVLGGDGEDFLDGGPGADELGGEAGNDQLAGRGGPDFISGGAGSDIADYSDATHAVTVSPNGVPEDGREGEMDNVDLDVEGAIGGTDSDVLSGNDGPGTFIGGDGDDRIDPGGGADAVTGGSGFDVMSYAGRSGAVTVDLGSAGNDGEAGEGDDLNPDLEQVTGGSGNDQLAGTDEANILLGGDGEDRLNGRGGLDRLEGGRNDDLLAGGTGQDILAGGDGNDGLDGGTADDSLDGGAGDDLASYATRTATVRVTLDGEPDDGVAGENDRIKTNVEGVAGGGGADRLDTRDGVAGDVSCGGGRDDLMADRNDRVDADCEQVNGVFGVCSVSSRGVRATRSRVRLRLSCSLASRGTVRLATATAVRVGKGKRRVRLGSRSFSARAGRSAPINVKVSRTGRRVLSRSKRLRVRVTVTARPRGQSANSASRRRTSRIVTLRVSGKQR